jgi:flavorubredoxin
MITLYESADHKNVFFNDLTSGHMVQANQHLIVHRGEGMVLDPGGHKVFPRLLAQVSSTMSVNQLKHVLFSHQDPDILAAANGWLMTTDARAYLSSLWMRFIPHFGVDEMVIDRITPIPDQGMVVDLAGCGVKFVPAHFLHSPGNFQVYDPEAKILYSGDLGASLGQPYAETDDLPSHLRYMEAFHKRYLAGSRALRAWVRTVRRLEIETIAPQHGAILRKPAVQPFIQWLDSLSCGVDLLDEEYPIPV